MLSPAGVPVKPENFDPSQLRMANGQKHYTLMRKLIMTAWVKKWSPFQVLRMGGKFFSRTLISDYLRRRMSSL
jgi:hypothetical protein